MPREATGEIRWSGKLATTRIRLWNGRETFEMPHAKDDLEAKARSRLLADIARRFRIAEVNRKQAEEALRIIAASSPRGLKSAVQIAEELLGCGRIFETGTEAPTFQAVANEWTDGKLRQRFPDEITEVKDRTKDVNVGRFKRYIFPHIGDKPIDEITREQCDEIKRALPADLGKETRRQICVLVTRVFNLAELAGYITRSPLPRGWTPKAKGKSNRKKFAVLYRDEDRKLLMCAKVPVALRLFYGFLEREGMRRSEGLALQWGDVDVEHGTVRLDENKTDHPRWWELSAGATAALKAWRECCGEVSPTDYVFADEHGNPLNDDHMADVLRAHLLAAGVDRPALHTPGKNWGRFGTHSFRRGFVTRAFAIDRNDAWIRRRSGHTSDELQRYVQDAEELRRVDGGDWDPLLLCIPELSGLEGLGQGLATLSAPRSLPRDCPENSRGGGIRTHDPQTPRSPRRRAVVRESRIPAALST